MYSKLSTTVGGVFSKVKGGAKRTEKHTRNDDSVVSSAGAEAADTTADLADVAVAVDMGEENISEDAGSAPHKSGAKAPGAMANLSSKAAASVSSGAVIMTASLKKEILSHFDPTPELVERIPASVSANPRVRYQDFISEDNTEKGFTCGFCVNGTVIVVDTILFLDEEARPMAKVILHHPYVPKFLSTIELSLGQQDIPVPFVALPGSKLGLCGVYIDSTLTLLRGDGTKGSKEDTSDRTLEGYNNVQIKLGLKVSIGPWSVPNPPIHMLDKVVPLSELARIKKEAGEKGALQLNRMRPKKAGSLDIDYVMESGVGEEE